MSIECERVAGINLAQGVCDTPVPAPARNAVQDAVNGGFNSYSRYDGIEDLRYVLAEKLARHNGLNANPDTDIVVSAGSTGAFYCACLALLDPGDEVILFEPFYGYHLNTLLAVEAVPVSVRMQAPDWYLSIEDLERAITTRTKAIVINTPVNPCGKIFSQAEMVAIAEVATKHDLIVFTDEIYEHFVYDGASHVSPATVEGLADRTVTISGVSKLLSVTGWRIGYTVSNPVWAEAIGYVNDLVYVCAPTPLQRAVAVGLRALDARFFSNLAVEFQEKRDLLCAALERSGLPPHVPSAAYYVLADVSAVQGASSKDKAMNLLNEIGVAGVPGEAFFLRGGGENLIRFCFARPDDELAAACKLIESRSRS